MFNYLTVHLNTYMYVSNMYQLLLFGMFNYLTVHLNTLCSKLLNSVFKMCYSIAVDATIICK